MDELLSNPAVQAGVAPFVAGLLAALLLQPLRLGGLAAAAAFLVAVQLVSGIQFSPLNATRKIVLLAMAAPLVGILVDFGFKPTRFGAIVLALAAGAGALWVVEPVLAQRAPAEAWILGTAAVVACAFLVGFSLVALAQDAVRAGAAALALGVGVGVAAILSASVAYGSYGIALGAGAGAFLLPQMLLGRRFFAGGTFTLPAMLIGGLVACGAMVLAKLPWTALLVFALVPLAVRLPGPERAPVWLQAVIFSAYGFAVAGLACFLAWP
ncbi:MAG TPA: hypothetical protein VF943_08715 [Burkholderiales bacterium]